MKTSCGSLLSVRCGNRGGVLLGCFCATKLPKSALALRIIAFFEIAAAIAAVLLAAYLVASGLQEAARLDALHESGSSYLGVSIGYMFAIFLLYLGLALLISGLPSAIATFRFERGRSSLSGAHACNLLAIALNAATCLVLCSTEPYAVLYWLAFAAILSILPAICLMLARMAVTPPAAKRGEHPQHPAAIEAQVLDGTHADTERL